MPLTFAKIAELANDETLRLRIGAAFGVVAVEILGDPESDVVSKQLAQRVVMTDTVNEYGTYVIAILTDPTVISQGDDESDQSDVPDEIIADRLRLVWGILAGILV